MTKNCSSAYFTRGETVSLTELEGADYLIYEIAERNIGNITNTPCYLPAPEANEPVSMGTLRGKCKINTEYELLYISGSIEEAVTAAFPRSEIIITLKNFDACRHAKDNELGYLPDADSFISIRRLDKGREQVSKLIDR